MPNEEFTDLTPRETERITIAAAASRPTIAGTAAGPVTTNISAQPALSRVSGAFIFWMMVANFGAAMAYFVPLSYSLALRINQLAPGHEEVLGYTTGIAQAFFIVTSPLVGRWSDRTFTRFGRRRPFIFGGVVVGLFGLLVIAFAPNVGLVIAGWTISLFGWSNAQAAISFLQTDRVPEEQRGKISGLTGLTSQIAPIVGIGLVYGVVRVSTALVFILPGLVGFVFVLLFVVRKNSEGDARDLPRPSESLSLKSVFGSYVFNPKKYPDFGWNWLGRFVFFMGLYFNTSFSAFFYSQRLNLPVQEVAGTVAIIGTLGVGAAIAGAIGGGFLSDKLRRRKLFTAIGAALFGVGAVVEAFAHSFPMLVIGAVIMNLAIAAFSAVDQAIVMAIVPSRAESGRYMSVVAFAQKIPSAIAPLIAPAIIGIGAVGGEKNYLLLYLVGGAFALVGGAIILTKVKAVR